MAQPFVENLSPDVKAHLEAEGIDTTPKGDIFDEPEPVRKRPIKPVRRCDSGHELDAAKVVKLKKNPGVGTSTRFGVTWTWVNKGDQMVCVKTLSSKNGFVVAAEIAASKWGCKIPGYVAKKYVPRESAAMYVEGAGRTFDY